MKYLGAIGLMAVGLGAQEIRPVQVVTGLTGLVDIQNAGDGSGRLFLVQQSGLVRVLLNGALLPGAFLDIRSKTRADGERGLLGLAFPPGFGATQRFYVDYTDLNGDTVIAQYRVPAGRDTADAASELVLLKIPQPFANHNGGQLRFGWDGYLYIGMGDGGSGGDPLGNGQNLSALLGKLLRIDVESSPGQVRVPADNPFVSRVGARGEIWAYGLRNPWRFSFDRATGDLWIADVGQGVYEEVDFQPAASRGGENYGWNRTEGLHCYQAGCQMQGLTLPVAEYTHAAGGCSVTGGFVYRGRLSPGLRGLYLYGDYCSGLIWGVERQGNAWSNRQLLASGFTITTFGEDESGELYVVNAGNGSVHHIEGSLAPRFIAQGVVNAASFAGGMVAGSIATVFAAGVRDDEGVQSADRLPLTKSLSGVSVTVGGIAAPVYSVSNVNGREQVNFQVPFALAERPVAAVMVTRDGRAGAPADVPLADAQPGVYTTDGTQAIVLHNAGYTLATSAHPLEQAEYAFLYVSGLGKVSTTPADGAAAPASPLARASADVRVTLGGAPCEVQFAGLAPGFAGVYQVNFRVPAEAASGSQEVVVIANGVASPAVRVNVR
ncbi:MAG: PQQ-dependent sugar dehydrogenase [Candidatus Solibacter sp.]